MNSPTITMEKDAALAKLGEYEEAMKKYPSLAREMDRSVMLGYRAIAKGKRLVDVNAAIAAGGLNLAGQPKLAISRAHVDRCWWRFNSPQHCFWWGKSNAIQDDRYRGDNWRWVAEGLAPCALGYTKIYDAMTPLIPLPLRPRHDLRNYFLLWEANWHPVPPIDPYLLRPVTGSLMEIVAEWSLTPLELAVVSAQAR